MNRSVVAICLIIAVVGTAGFIGAVSADTSYTVTINNGEIDIPDTTEEGFTVTSVAPIEPGNDISASIDTGENNTYDLLLYNGNRGIEDRRLSVTGSTTERFQTTKLDPGIYSVTISTDRIETIQPVVVEGYDTTLSPPSSVTQGDSADITMDVTEHAGVNAPAIKRVEAVVANESFNKRIQADKTASGEYTATMTPAYSPGEYRVYGVVYESETVENGELNIISMTDEQSVEITEQSDSGDTTEGGSAGGGGGGGAPAAPPEEPATEASQESNEDMTQRATATVEPTADSNAAVASFERGSPVEEITFDETGVSGTVDVSTQSTPPEDVTSPPGSPVAVSNITVPESARTTSATIRLNVTTNTSNPSEDTLQVTRLADGTWSDLPFSVVESTETGVILAVETPGFSYFAVSERTDPSTATNTDSSAGSETTSTDTEDTTGSETNTSQTEASSESTASTTDSTPGFGLLAAVMGLLLTTMAARLVTRRHR